MKLTFLIEHTNTVGSWIAPVAVCPDYHEAIEWCLNRYTEHQPVVMDADSNIVPRDKWADDPFVGVFVVPSVSVDGFVPIQYRVRAITEIGGE